MGGARLQTFTQWLEALNLEHYTQTFADNEVGLEAMRLLDDADLRELGLPLGPPHQTFSPEPGERTVRRVVM